MKKFVMMVCAGWILLGACVAKAAPTGAETYQSLHTQSRIDKKEARKLKKENRKAMRGEYKYRTKNSVKMRLDRERIDRENFRQRKKMDKAARKQNRGHRYDANELGSVFEGL